MEDDAYRLAGDRESLFESLFHGKEVSHEGCACLATPGSGLRFWQRLIESAPGRLPHLLRVPWAGGSLLFWTAAVAVLALTKGLVEGVGAVLVLLLRPFRS